MVGWRWGGSGGDGPSGAFVVTRLCVLGMELVVVVVCVWWQGSCGVRMVV